MTTSPLQLLKVAQEALDAATVPADHPARLAAERALADALEVDENGNQAKAVRQAVFYAQKALGAD